MAHKKDTVGHSPPGQIKFEPLHIDSSNLLKEVRITIPVTNKPITMLENPISDLFSSSLSVINIILIAIFVFEMAYKLIFSKQYLAAHKAKIESLQEQITALKESNIRVEKHYNEVTTNQDKFYKDSIEKTERLSSMTMVETLEKAKDKLENALREKDKEIERNNETIAYLKDYIDNPPTESTTIRIRQFLQQLIKETQIITEQLTKEKEIVILEINKSEIDIEEKKSIFLPAVRK